MKKLRLPFLLALISFLTACGFHLRGEADYALPFKTLYIQAPDARSAFVNELKRNLIASNVQIVDAAEQSPLILHIASEDTHKQILSLSAAGRVLEYRIQFQIAFRVYDAKQRDWMAPGEITLQRSYTYDDSQVLAKAKEEAVLYQDMRTDAVQQIMRRLNRVKEPKAVE
ncbi:MAG: LPS assembly lipoprotein LptE [Gallionellaceae bacterium]|jgi:LPS-assembly lipoprotein|nr:LPS assembly lipoprotein LptE [Gallionellaceae bacterium]